MPTEFVFAFKFVSVYVSVADAEVLEVRSTVVPTWFMLGVTPTWKETVLGEYVKPTPAETLPTDHVTVRELGSKAMCSPLGSVAPFHATFTGKVAETVAPLKSFDVLVRTHVIV